MCVIVATPCWFDAELYTAAKGGIAVLCVVGERDVVIWVYLERMGVAGCAQAERPRHPTPILQPANAGAAHQAWITPVPAKDRAAGSGTHSSREKP